VWAWRKSGIKILVTAGGLLFFTFFQFFQKRVDFGHFFSQPPQESRPRHSKFIKMDEAGEKSDEAGEKSDEAGKKVTRRGKNHPRTRFLRFLVQNWRFRSKFINQGVPRFLSEVLFLDEARIYKFGRGEDFYKFGGSILARKVRLAHLPPQNCPAPNPLRPSRPAGSHGFHYPLNGGGQKGVQNGARVPPSNILKNIYIYIRGGGESSPRPVIFIKIWLGAK